MDPSQLNFPAYSFTFRKEKDRQLIFDPVRRRYVTLTPEEWVRQHVIQFLIKSKDCPAGLLSVEGSINLFRTAKRYDLAVFDRQGKPLLVVECKSPDVALNQSVIDQIIRYNMTVNAPYLYVTNGLIHLFLKKDQKGYRQIKELPLFSDLAE